MTAETIDYWRPPGLTGLEVLTVHASTRSWRSLHAQHAFCAVLAGGGRWLHRGVVHESGPGTVRSIAPGEVHRDLEVRGPTSCVVLFVAPALVDAVARELGRPAGPCAAVTDDPACFAAVRRWLDPPSDPAAVVAELRATLRTLLLRTAPADPHADPHQRAHAAVQRARALLHDRFDQPLALDDIASASGLTGPHLVRTFHAEVGLPPFEYLMHLRVARAREGLRAGRSPADAALACGFCDQSHLTRWFKKVVGITPGRYAQPRPSRGARRHGALGA